MTILTDRQDVMPERTLLQLQDLGDGGQKRGGKMIQSIK